LRFNAAQDPRGSNNILNTLNWRCKYTSSLLFPEGNTTSLLHLRDI
jgi:hypothetical protein